jgi:hypothetical protein
LRAEIFGHVSGAIYVPEARVFGDVQQTLGMEIGQVCPEKGSLNCNKQSRNPVSIVQSRYSPVERFLGQQSGEGRLHPDLEDQKVLRRARVRSCEALLEALCEA